MNKNMIDTNVLLRYLLDDIEDMALVAEQVIEGGAWTTPEMIAETTYVLEKAYETSRRDIVTALNEILIHVEVRPFEIVKRAIREYEITDLDFVDCMMVAYAMEGNERVFTFDKGINKRLSDCRMQGQKSGSEADSKNP